ncbi:hypothetical protein EM6_2545 [Asticcacaulis excentricus]|uniref:Uncharacterized protein n=2 Tax=Asticcacaulis excentricus TaxID=78587 RepID=A0A3G9GBH2_9CAUL|nr:hypothetical protein EM6_2545 [Asticcacaulis excentricus]
MVACSSLIGWGYIMTNRILFAFVCVIAFYTSVANLSQGQGVFDRAQAQVKTEDAEKAEKVKKEKEQYNSINWPPSFQDGVVCYFNTTYDRKEGDINQSPGNYSPDMGSEDLRKAVEVVQTSWFRRSACMRDIRRTNALLSSVGAVGYLASKDNVTPAMSNGFATLALAAVINDQLRSVSPLSRFYTGAVTGTHLASRRNTFVKQRVEQLNYVVLSDVSGCKNTLGLQEKAKKLTAAANSILNNKPGSDQVPELVNKFKLNVDDFKRWCDNYQITRSNFVLFKNSQGDILNKFNGDRVGAWLRYKQFVNTVGQENRPTAYSALSRIITTPFDVASKLLGGGDDSLVLRNAGTVQSKSVMAMEMPLLNLQAISIPKPGRASYSIELDYQQTRDALQPYFDLYCAKGKSGAATKACKDYNNLNVSAELISNAKEWHHADAKWRKIDAYFTELQTENARRFLWINLDNGTASVGVESLTATDATAGSKPQP